METNNSIHALSQLALNGTIGLRDFMVFARILFGDNPKMANMIADAQIFVAVISTARTALKALEVEIGPIGWGVLTGTTVLSVATADYMMNPGG